MDLPPLHTLPAQKQNALTSKATPQLTQLSETLVDVKLQARVEQVVQLSEAQRQALIKGLSQSELNSATNATTQQPVKSLSTLVNAPALQLVRISTQIRSELLSRSTETPPNIPHKLQLLTDIKIPIGSQLEVSVRKDGNLQLLNIVSQDKIQTTQTTLVKTEAYTPTDNTARTRVLQEALRRHLPYDQPQAKNITAIKNIAETLSTLPTKTQNSLLSTNTVKLIQKVVQPLTGNKMQLNPNVIKQLLNNSGLFLESTIKPETPPPTVAQSNLLSGQELSKQPNNLDTKKLLLDLFHQSSATTKENHLPLTEQAKMQAIKPANLQQALSGAASNLRGVDSVLAAITHFKTPANQNLTKLTEIRQHLARTLASASALGIANITSNQLRQLLSNAPEGQAGNSYAFDIPLRLQDQVLPLTLQLTPHYYIEDDAGENASQSSSREAKKQTRWQIFMELELPEFGWLATEISLTGDHVKTRFWSESDNIKTRAKNRLESLKKTLEKNGLEVDDIILEPGNPPARTQPISQSLVDIRT
ncbi:flagellar hook-length control protein FliK [Teredinibacter haidensis]|uniref:flagellar hook-length control protein FliK n=1 Tax=Teredinibacter haidensis TaxID=2731755 RepID=UPI000948E858|nr:flagellar hook-length control protein FliK [Teredinibacter haidensis]